MTSLSKALKAKYGAGFKQPGPIVEDNIEHKPILKQPSVRLFKMDSYLQRHSKPEDLFTDVLSALDDKRIVHLDFSDMDALPTMDYFQDSIGKLISDNHIRLEALRGKLKFKFSERCSDKLQRIIKMLHKSEKLRIPKQRTKEIGLHLKSTTRGTGKVILSEG